MITFVAFCCTGWGVHKVAEDGSPGLEAGFCGSCVGTFGNTVREWPMEEEA